MGLGDTLGALPPECGGTGRTSPGMVACGASVSGQSMTVSLPSGMTMDGFSLFVGINIKVRYEVWDSNISPVIIPTLAIEGGLSIDLVISQKNTEAAPIALQLAKNSDSGFTATVNSNTFKPTDAGTWYAL